MCIQLKPHFYLQILIFSTVNSMLYLPSTYSIYRFLKIPGCGSPPQLPGQIPDHETPWSTVFVAS